MILRRSVVFWAAVLWGARARAQESPQELADRVSQAWAAGADREFAAVVPFREAQDVTALATRNHWSRGAGIGQVIRNSEGKAVLVLGGVPLTGNSGDDTYFGWSFSGLYEASAVDGRWRLTRQIPLEETGSVISQRLQVRVRPGRGLDVEDRLIVRSNGSNGFAARLNHHAKLQEVTSGRGSVAHHFGGSLLWADLPQGTSELVLRYSIAVETETPDPNSGRFTERFGHVRNQYFWHPLFDFQNPADQADFEAEVRIPKEYALTTSLPQTERIDGDDRIIEAKSIQRTMALSLAYDRDWKVVRETANGVQLELFVTPDFRPEPTSVVQEFRSVHSLLASRFGEPGGGYLAIVQLRGYPTNGWRFNSNQGVFAEGSPGYFSLKDPPSAHLGHEIGHLWTQGAGPAANFLREGWATYVESLVLEQEYGADTARLFWKEQARLYFQFFDGRRSILEEKFNSNLHYNKGSWIFRMLESAVGTDAFRSAMREYSRRSLAGEATWEVLAECFQKQKGADFDARGFLLPWLQEKSAPDLRTQVAGRRVNVRVQPPFTVLPVVVEAKTMQGTERQTVWVRGGEATVEFGGDVTEVRLDPDELLLARSRKQQ